MLCKKWHPAFSVEIFGLLTTAMHSEDRPLHEEVGARVKGRLPGICKKLGGLIGTWLFNALSGAEQFWRLYYGY